MSSGDRNHWWYIKLKGKRFYKEYNDKFNAAHKIILISTKRQAEKNVFWSERVIPML